MSALGMESTETIVRVGEPLGTAPVRVYGADVEDVAVNLRDGAGRHEKRPVRVHRHSMPRAALLCLALVACGASAREKTLKTSLVVLDTAQAAFLTYDAQHQLDIVAAAPSKGEAHAELDAYRKARTPVIEALETSYRALAAAAIVDSDPKDLDNLKAALGIVADALAHLGVKP